MPKLPKKGFYVFLAIYLAAILAMGSWIDRKDTLPLLLAYASAFLSYLLILQRKDSAKLLFGFGISLRLMLFFTLPVLSDDVYRFIWDGTLTVQGIDPYAKLPLHYLEKDVPGISKQLFQLLNSPSYFTVYPPLNQAFFWLAVTISQGSWLTAANALRTVLLLADIGSFLALQKLLVHYKKPAHLAFCYFLNPLVILEFTGNVHFEGLLICFLLLGIYFYERNKKVLAATAFGLSIATKLLPLIYLPFLLIKERSKWTIAPLAFFIAALTLLPLLTSSFFQGMKESLDLYFHSFEFNASVYFILRQLGYWITGYNQIATIGTILAFTSVITIVILSVLGLRRRWSIPAAFLFILTSYLTLSTTVHPWYILSLLPLGLLAGFWYPLLWSFLIFLTYLGYSATGFELPVYVIVIEYVCLWIMILFELRLKWKSL